MRSFVHFSFTLLVGLAVALFWVGCGSANNDQGVSITFLGFFTEIPTDPNDCTKLPTSESGKSVALSTLTESAVTGNTTDSSVPAIVGFSNNLSGEFFRVQTVYLSYYIEGASSQPPDSAVPTNVFLLAPSGASSSGSSSSGSSGSTGSTTTSTGSSSGGSTVPVPVGNDKKCSRGFTTIQVVTPEIREWLNLNRESIPEPPFNMVVTAHATGLTSSGNRDDTNDFTYFVQILPDNVIPPTDGGSVTDNGTTSSNNATL